MSSSPRVVDAIRELSRQLTERSLPQDTDEVVELVVQQRQLLEAYIRSTPTTDIDPLFIRGVSAEIRELIDRAKQAHMAAADELDALTLARSAVTAYEGSL